MSMFNKNAVPLVHHFFVSWFLLINTYDDPKHFLVDNVVQILIQSMNKLKEKKIMKVKKFNASSYFFEMCRVLIQKYM